MKRYRKSNEQIAKANRRDHRDDNSSMSAFPVKTEAFEELNIVEHSFCRCCFKSMDLMEVQYPVDEQLVAIFRDLTQLTVESCLQASSFCEICYNQVLSLNHFKKLAIARQAKFNEIQSRHGDFRELYQLHLPSETVETVFKEEKLGGETIKQEIMFDDESSPDVISKYRDESGERDENCYRPKRNQDQSSAGFDACQICGIRVRSLRHHTEKVHEKMKRYFCDICDFGAYLKSQITKHVKTTHMTPGISCDWCDYKTTSNYSLEKHLDTQHAGKRVPVPCKMCSKTFFWRHNLKSHVMRCHDKIKPHRCPHCPMEFFGQGALRSVQLLVRLTLSLIQILPGRT